MTLNDIINVVPVFVTILLIIINLIKYNENKKNQKINDIDQKLEKFYYPLKFHIDLYKDERMVSHVKSETHKADFINYRSLCQNEKITAQLNELIDMTSTGGANRLKHIEKKVNEDIQNFLKDKQSLTKVRRSHNISS